MKAATDTRLDDLRGTVKRQRLDARKLAALENNPRCMLRAVSDASGADKAAIAAHAGFPAPFGQSSFAIGRGLSFEAKVTASGGAELLRVLRETLNLALSEVGWEDLTDVGGDAGNGARHARTTRLLVSAAQGRGDGTLYLHPMLKLVVGGHAVFLEPDLVAFRIDNRFHIVEIKSFPIIDEQADPALVRSATTQAAAYIIALRAMLAEAGIGPAAVSDKVVLVAPKDFTNRPTGAFIDARKQVATLARQLARIDRIDSLVALLPHDLTFDLEIDADRGPQRPVQDLTAALDQVPIAYRPDCLNHCDLAFYCRDRARNESSLDVLGPEVREQLGGIDTWTMALGLAQGQPPTADQKEIAGALIHAARIRKELTQKATSAGGAQ